MTTEQSPSPEKIPQQFQEVIITPKTFEKSFELGVIPKGHLLLRKDIIVRLGFIALSNLEYNLQKVEDTECWFLSVDYHGVKVLVSPDFIYQPKEPPVMEFPLSYWNNTYFRIPSAEAPEQVFNLSEVQMINEGGRRLESYTIKVLAPVYSEDAEASYIIYKKEQFYEALQTGELIWYK